MKNGVEQCRFEGGCKAPLSAIKLSPLDKLILALFQRSPWIEVATFSKHGIIKRSLDLNQAQVIARAMRLPWNNYVLKKLQICESLILKQQNDRIQYIESQSDNKRN